MTLLSNVREDGGSRDKARELGRWQPAAPHASSSALRTNWTRPLPPLSSGCPTCELLPEPEGSGSHTRRGPAGPGWLFSPDHKGHNTPRVTDSKILCSFLTTSLNQDLTKSFQFTNLATSKQNHRS